jgi:hypothetical protein
VESIPRRPPRGLWLGEMSSFVGSQVAVAVPFR